MEQTNIDLLAEIIERGNLVELRQFALKCAHRLDLIHALQTGLLDNQAVFMAEVTRENKG